MLCAWGGRGLTSFTWPTSVCRKCSRRMRCATHSYEMQPLPPTHLDDALTNRWDGLGLPLRPERTRCREANSARASLIASALQPRGFL